MERRSDGGGGLAVEEEAVVCFAGGEEEVKVMEGLLCVFAVMVVCGWVFGFCCGFFGR